MKIKIMKCLLIVFLLITMGRLYYLQVIKYNHYKEILKQKNNITFTSYSAPRGRILDCNGKVIVDNEGIKVISYHQTSGINKSIELNIALAISKYIDDVSNTISINEEYSLAKYNEVKTLNNEEEREAYVYYLMHKGYSYDNKVLMEDVDDLTYSRILEMNLPGIFGEVRWKRINKYNYSFIGNIGSIPYENKQEYLDNGYKLNDIVGISYLEKEYDKDLRGVDKVYKINNDNSISIISDEIKGKDLRLNIDLDLQNSVNNILKDQMKITKTKMNSKYYNHSYIIVSDPLGNVKTLVGNKIYGNNNQYNMDITNQIFTSSYTMGSIVKGASMTVGYQNNLIDINKKIKDGCIKLYNNPLKCSWKSLGYINDLNALKYSSNYYQFMIALDLMGKSYKYNMKLEDSESAFIIYRKTFNEYGLGVKSGIDIPNEGVGIIGNKIDSDLLLNFSIGQYDTYTPIQIASYINTIASNGNRYQLNIAYKNNTLLNKVEIDEENMKRIQKGFKMVFEYGGTASNYIDEKIVTVAGKTGTSESFLDSDNDGIIDTKTITTTLGVYFPYENPQYTITIISPHISYVNGNNSYKYNLNKYLVREIITKMFALYKTF